MSSFWRANNKMKRCYSLLFLILFCSCQSLDEPSSGWQMVFKNDADGQAIFGKKSTLLDAVRLGYPVRVGWGSNRVEHVADANFLTIFQGEDVFAQIKTIVGQAPQIDGDSLKIRFRTQNHWTKIIGTNGFSTALMTDYVQDTIVGVGPDRYSTTAWYVLMPSHQLEIEARPLWRKESPNWEKWKEEQKSN